MNFRHKEAAEAYYRHLERALVSMDFEEKTLIDAMTANIAENLIKTGSERWRRLESAFLNASAKVNKDAFLDAACRDAVAHLLFTSLFKKKS